MSLAKLSTQILAGGKAAYSYGEPCPDASSLPFSRYIYLFFRVSIANSHMVVSIDCDDAYRTPKDLIKHCLLEHKNDSYRPMPIPSKPETASLPTVPMTLPSYMVIPRDIRQAPILKDRHASIGPWVSISSHLFWLILLLMMLWPLGFA